MGYCMIIYEQGCRWEAEPSQIPKPLFNDTILQQSPRTNQKNNLSRRHQSLPTTHPQPPQVHLLPPPQHPPPVTHNSTRSPLHTFSHPCRRRPPRHTNHPSGIAFPRLHQHRRKTARSLLVLLFAWVSTGSTRWDLSIHRNHRTQRSRNQTRQVIENRCLLNVTNPYHRDAYMQQRFHTEILEVLEEELKNTGDKVDERVEAEVGEHPYLDHTSPSQTVMQVNKYRTNHSEKCMIFSWSTKTKNSVDTRTSTYTLCRKSTRPNNNSKPSNKQLLPTKKHLQVHRVWYKPSSPKLTVSSTVSKSATKSKNNHKHPTCTRS